MWSTSRKLMAGIRLGSVAVLVCLLAHNLVTLEAPGPINHSSLMYILVQEWCFARCIPCRNYFFSCSIVTWPLGPYIDPYPGKLTLSFVPIASLYPEVTSKFVVGPWWIQPPWSCTLTHGADTWITPRTSRSSLPCRLCMVKMYKSA